MKKSDPIKWIVTLGLCSILLLMSVVSYITLAQVESNISRIANLVEVTNSKTAAAHTMRDIIRMRGDVLAEMQISSDVFEREELRLQLHKLSREYKIARDKLEKYASAAREFEILSRLRPQAEIAREENDNAADVLLTETNHTLVTQQVLLADTARNNLLSVLDDLVKFQEQQSSATLADNLKYQDNTNTIIIYLTLLTLCIGTLIAIQVVKHTTARNQAINHRARHDSLTNLVNRAEFKTRLTSSMHNSSKDIKHALCYLDLDQFKIINDTCGHRAGDELLKQITSLIQSHIRTRDILGRLGGDEFGLLLENCSLDKALEICEGIVTVVKQHQFYWNDRTYHVGVSIGLVPVQHNTSDIETLMTEADLACYAAKDMGRNRVHVHKTKGSKVRKLQQELNWVADIHTTIESNRFELHAQPIVPCKGSETVAMYEVLLRLRNNQGRIISPGNYIPAAERFNLMKEVDTWVTRKAILFLHNKHSADHECNLRLFVNLSANSIVNHDFLAETYQLLTQYPIPHQSLCLEITETSAIQNIDQAIKFMHCLKRYGCLFALDDFGSGMSSFSYLKNLPVDYIKIDGNIVRNIENSKADEAMVAAINEIGRVMAIETIAEFVEQPEVYKMIKQMGVDYAQGFHICKPTALNNIKTRWPSQNVYHL